VTTLGKDKDRLLTVRGNDRRHRDRAVSDNEASVLSREKLVTAREDVAHSRENAADLREDAAHPREEETTSREDAANLREETADLREETVTLREETATLREREIGAVEAMHAASEDHMVILQQVNERLVIATVEAQKLAEQVQITTTQLEGAKFVAEKASLAKSDFLSRMSHELRTPLNAILGFAQLMAASSPPPTPTQTVRLQHIIQSGWYLLELINEILDLATIEAGKLSLSHEPISLAEVMLECEAMIEPQALKRDIHINFLPVAPDWLANADRIRVKQILLNLFSNAIKYNRKHGTVEVKCTGTPEHIRISIKDSGMGMSAEKLAQLFQAFNRLGQETGDKEGTGIGLVVTKQLVELMGGRIGVESTVGVGSEFWIELIRYVTPQIDVAGGGGDCTPITQTINSK
jgi:signal transduction histidine kinase